MRHWKDDDQRILLALKRQNFHLLFTSVQIILAIILFLSGFFPIKYPSDSKASFQDLPTKVGNISVDPHSLYKPRIDKVVIMIIDALRYDMVLPARSSLASLHHWLERKEHCVIRARVEAPTVTMPRIKALMTGDPPGYIDVLFNFRTYEAREDSFLYQAANRGLLSVFYGDETWLRVFPGLFNRTETTHSFFVTDFTEVDSNVTRNVERELLATDWSLMVLHYLGLDHIGHLFSPSSALIEPKLIEMDKVIGLIMDYVTEREKKSEKVVLLVGSDHGMKDTGGHGGTSPGEVIIPYIQLNQDCDENLRKEDLNQIDIAPMLSVLLGLPIPANSIGALDRRMLTTLTPYESLYAMHYNSKLLYAKYQKSFDTNSTIQLLGSSISEAMAKAEESFEKAIGEDFRGIGHMQATFYYHNVQKVMSHALVQMGVGYHIPALQFTLGWIFLMFCNNLGCGRIEDLSTKRPLSGRTLYVCLVAYLVYHFDPLGGFNSLRFSTTFVLFCYGFIIWNVYIFSPLRWMISITYQWNQILFYLGFVTHALLSLSTSFLEEEHTFWYYLFSSYLFHRYLCEGKASILYLMFLHSVCTYFNSAGVKYSDKYDFGDFLNSPNNSTLLFTIYVIGLFSVRYLYDTKIFRKTWYLPCRYESLFSFTYNTIFVTVFLLQIYSGRIVLPFVVSNRFSDWITPLYLWTLLIVGTSVSFILWFPIFLPSFRNHVPNFQDFLGVYFLDVYLFVCCVIYSAICPPHNIVLVATIIYYSSFFRDYCRDNIFTLTAWHLILAMVGFYYQGNSLSLASIDVAVGYRTLVNPNIFISSSLVYLYTFGLLIIAVLYLFRSVFAYMVEVSELHTCIGTLTTFSIAYMFFICSQTTIQRHHLFVWSVFAPKLLYTSALIGTINLLIIFILLVYMFNQYVFPPCLGFLNNIFVHFV